MRWTTMAKQVHRFGWKQKGTAGVLARTAQNNNSQKPSCGQNALNGVQAAADNGRLAGQQGRYMKRQNDNKT